MKVGFVKTVAKLEAILQEYSELPEYSEMDAPSVDTKSLFGDYPINIAASRGLIDEVSTLFNSGANINAIGEHGYTPLHNAVEQGHINVVRFLVSLGANPDNQNADGSTPIQLAQLLDESDIFNFLKSNQGGRP